MKKRWLIALAIVAATFPLQSEAQVRVRVGMGIRLGPVYAGPVVIAPAPPVVCYPASRVILAPLPPPPFYAGCRYRRIYFWRHRRWAYDRDRR